MSKLRFFHAIFSHVVFAVLAVVGAVALIFHNYELINLQKPAGIAQAVAFLFHHFSDYIGAFLLGAGAWITGFLLVVACVVVLIGNLNSSSDYGYYEEGRIISWIEFSIKLLISIALLVLCGIFASYTWLLALVLVTIGFIAYAFFDQM